MKGVLHLSVSSFVLPGYHPIHYSHVYIWDHPSYNTALLKKVTPRCVTSSTIRSAQYSSIQGWWMMYFILSHYTQLEIWNFKLCVKRMSIYRICCYGCFNMKDLACKASLPQSLHLLFFFSSLFLIVLVISDLMALVRHFLLIWKVLVGCRAKDALWRPTFLVKLTGCEPHNMNF